MMLGVHEAPEKTANCDWAITRLFDRNRAIAHQSPITLRPSSMQRAYRFWLLTVRKRRLELFVLSSVFIGHNRGRPFRGLPPPSLTYGNVCLRLAVADGKSLC